MARVNRGRSQRIFADSRRRKVSWAAGPGGNVLALTSSVSALFGTASEATIDDLTTIRTRGQLTVALNAASAIDEGFSWAFGICNVTQNAAGVGITAVPTPRADIAWDGWMVFMQGELFARDATPLDEPNLFQVYEIDSKAMRKTHATDNLVAVVEVGEVGAASVSFHLGTRILDKLP